MINVAQQVVDGIVLKLDKYGLPIYTDQVKSNLQYPCFIVNIVNIRHKRVQMNQFEDRVPIQIAYIPDGDEEETQVEFTNIVTYLQYALEQIDIGDGVIVWGTNFSAESMRGTLYFDVDYMVRLKEVLEKPVMKRMEVNIDTKED